MWLLKINIFFFVTLFQDGATTLSITTFSIISALIIAVSASSLGVVMLNVIMLNVVMLIIVFKGQCCKTFLQPSFTNVPNKLECFFLAGLSKLI